MCNTATVSPRVLRESHRFFQKQKKYSFLSPSHAGHLKVITRISMFMTISLLMRQSELAEVVSKDLH